MNRYLTKSRFKLATECPTKLFYTGKIQYPDTKLDDAFLTALADGGFQVGELAKQYFPQGHEITTLDYEEAISQTNKLLNQEEVVIFEPAIRFGNLFIRVDILVKNGNFLELIEVKAKSYSKHEDKNFLNKSGKLESSWKPYIFDVAFQKHVLQSAFPDAQISSYLMLVDKDSQCATSGLNQKFKLIKNENNRREVVTDELSERDLKAKILKQVNVDHAVNLAYENELKTGYPANSFKENIIEFANYYQQDEKIAPVIGAKCKKCEFKTNNENESQKSGFKECWKQQLNWQEKDFSDPTVLDIANFKSADKCIQNGKIKLKDIEKEDINYKESGESALSQKERQWLQIEKVQNQDQNIFFDSDGLKKEMEKWTYPLHFIDFETSAVAIPFYQGMHPYEGIAFQFSHHILHENGKVEHAGQFLCTEQGEFPNFNFVRELKAQLEQDNGTIFRYSNHENTYLNMVLQQLKCSNETDSAELCEFIKSITKSTAKSNEHWIGKRCMVDQLELVKKYHYDPVTNGSNSLKAVLPAILNSSNYLKEKYSKPIYGTEEIHSHNFVKKTWIQFDDAGKVNDPYKTLPKLFDDITDHDVELLSETDELNNGGLALTAYAKMQFTEMSDYERNQLQKALLMYCELDTFAMVMLQEAWQVMLKQK
ncbi:DUF2779 domain-containing protein [Pseudoalteromonas sp. G4]|uniref:DUF2779 domain-containing protein n=1 Tax=Pseudoalteromonas sp. G4 TaxID=2992761 RepID=UPI00237DE428|nr:DUF2779 domain-containing protein [Pseudoalteromonas sp. G4]MDE3271387.1 DUF2779 domain-containing protein [Pseudoalteromonas sp. G4]